ncbi:hypothetical protein LINPERPRIM_LOCUS14773 [Linum perenne]
MCYLVGRDQLQTLMFYAMLSQDKMV